MASHINAAGYDAYHVCQLGMLLDGQPLRPMREEFAVIRAYERPDPENDPDSRWLPDFDYVDAFLESLRGFSTIYFEKMDYMIEEDILVIEDAYAVRSFFSQLNKDLSRMSALKVKLLPKKK